ncbi:MAG TPA: DUF5672 family protein [Burkholderiales bacterium]|nr:DUF5672 family protein [Burkholderiales bacterium]
MQQTWRAMWRGRLHGVARPPAENFRREFDARMEADNYLAAHALAAAAVAGDPAAYEPQLLLGRAYQKLHDPIRALACFEAALRRRDDDPELYDFRGAMYQELGRLQDAFADYERALALRPDFPLASFHLGMARLLNGDFERGWEGYDLRRLSAEYAPAAGTPRWDGSPLAGRRLLVSREQGLGDEIMFASILPQLVRQTAQCFVECDPRLRALFARSIPGATFIASQPGGGVPPGALPEAPDFFIEAGSLPRLFRRGKADFPRHDGYLRADPDAVARWRARLAAFGPGLKVGLAWTGGVRRTRIALRSIELEQLLPVLRAPGVRFISLQYTDDARRDIEALRERHGIAIEHWPEAIDDYEQTAALACAVDLVLSVCTALVHLGGALGRPVWVMAPLGPEWRYGAAGDSMPWYPSVRLFRQSTYRDWQPVIDSVSAELRALASGGARSSADTTRRDGAAFARDGRYEEALAALRTALTIEPTDAATANLAGVCCSLLHRYDEAMSFYDRALAIEPALADALANAGWTATLLGRGDANRYFRGWISLQPGPTHGAAIQAPASRLRLPDVTLCCVDSAYHDLAAKALRTTLAKCDFARCLFISDHDCGVAGVEFIPIERIASLADYSNFMVHRLCEYIDTSHVLVMQYDGFVLNPAAWDPAFLQYDYIGPAVRLPGGSAGGIGGFSLRSRKLLAALRDDPVARAYDAVQAPYAEDIAICCAMRRQLESAHGIRFAPGDLADRFAAEAIAPTARTFGFHNLMHLVCLYQNAFVLQDGLSDSIRITFRADSVLGPVIAHRELELRARGDTWARFMQPG